jgi:23S rRNA (guanosine2251-2'-O)-methyltransferase
MVNQANLFYECENPGCRLRFPGYDGHTKWNRCPICRSTVHQVATVIDPNQENITERSNLMLPVEGMLDNIRSAWNVGSIFRSADGVGISKLYLCGITPTPDNLKVVKTSLGAENSVPWEKYNNGVLLGENLKAKGYQLWALENISNAQALFEIPPGKPETPIVLIVGNELSGIDPGIVELCDKVIAIPMTGNKQSYNVSVAFGIAASFLLYTQSFSHGSRSILPKT